MQNDENETDSGSHEAARDSTAASRVLGIAAFAALILWAITGKSDLGAFIDPRSFAIAFLGPVALLIASFGWRGAKAALGTLFSRSSSQRETTDAASFFRLAAVFALACGFLGALIGLVIMLQNMDAPATIGPALALTLLTQLYGVLLAVLSVVSATVVSRRQATARTSTELDRLGRQAVAVGAPAPAIGVLAVVVPFLAVLAGMFG